MKTPLFLVALFFLVMIGPSSAQDRGEITTKPICGTIVNKAGQSVMLTIDTKAQRIESGDMVRHSENFKLLDEEEREICARGPFYEGQRLELTIRSLVPLFTCQTKIDKPVIIQSTLLPSGAKKLSATCH
jgi:hypothetical protein